MRDTQKRGEGCVKAETEKNDIHKPRNASNHQNHKEEKNVIFPRAPGGIMALLTLILEFSPL